MKFAAFFIIPVSLLYYPNVKYENNKPIRFMHYKAIPNVPIDLGPFPLGLRNRIEMNRSFNTSRRIYV